MGLVITLILFIFMHSMISLDSNKLVESEVYKVIDFIQVAKNDTVPEVDKELPPEPVAQEKPPEIQTESQESKSDTVNDSPALDIDMPSLGNDMKFGEGAPKILEPIKMAKMDSVLSPMIKIQPLYPSSAKRMGTEGHVKVELDVNSEGYVVNIKILESVPSGIFDRSVKKALRKWKFRPKTVDGKAVAQIGVLTLNFNLGK